MSVKILIVDDDKKLQKLLTTYLQEYGFNVTSLFTAENTLSEIKNGQPEIVILDIVLPDGNGLDLLRTIRRESTLPVIMLSAKGEETDRIVGLEMGADDYLPKPFSSRELLARINAVLRRPKPGEAETVTDNANNGICVGGIVLDRNRQCLSKGIKEAVLTFTEYRILEVLMSRPNMVFSREELMNRARGTDYAVFDRTIDMHISRIRSKLESVSGSGNHIKTAWGTGYMYVDE